MEAYEGNLTPSAAQEATKPWIDPEYEIEIFFRSPNAKNLSIKVFEYDDSSFVLKLQQLSGDQICIPLDQVQTYVIHRLTAEEKAAYQKNRNSQKESGENDDEAKEPMA